VRAPKHKGDGTISILIYFPGSTLNPKFSEEIIHLLDFPDGPLDLEQTISFEEGKSPSFTASLSNLNTQIASNLSKKGNKVILHFPRDGEYEAVYKAKGYNTRSDYFKVEQKKIAHRTNIPETIGLFFPRHMQIRYQHSRNGQFTETSPPQTMLWSEAIDQIISDDWYFGQTILENGQPGIVINFNHWGKTNGWRTSKQSFDDLLKAPKNGYRPVSDKSVHKGDVFLFKASVEGSDVFTKVEIIEISNSPIEE